MKNGARRQQTRFYYSTSESIMKTASMLFTASLALSSLSAVAGAGQALQLTPFTDRDAARTIAEAIGRIRYRPAGPEVLARLESEWDRFWQVWRRLCLLARRSRRQASHWLGIATPTQPWLATICIMALPAEISFNRRTPATR